MFTLEEILKATKGRFVCGDKKTTVKGISTDTRKISAGELFIALKGDRFDGHQFLKDAFKKGAKAAIINRNRYRLSRVNNRYLSLIKVKDTMKALGAIASVYRRRLKIPIVGLTGSNGKTTVKDMIAHILSKRYKVARTPGTENNQIGVPLAVLAIKDESFAVIEIGTSLPGEINYLSQIVRPYIGLITNIGPSHLQGLKSERNILKEKSKLFNHLEKGGYAIINRDDPHLSSLRTKNKRLTFGINNKGCDYYADKIANQKNDTRFTLNKRYKFRLPAFGVHNVYNALAAISVCSALGIDVKFIQKALLDFRPAKMRFSISRFKGINIINDAYNSNPLSMKAALETLGALKTKGKKIVVAADMLELGKNAAKLHYCVGRMIAKNGTDILITVGKLAANMAKGAKDNGMDNIRIFNKQKNAAGYLKNISKPGDAILVKGSRAMRMEEVIKCFITYYTR